VRRTLSDGTDRGGWIVQDELLKLKKAASFPMSLQKEKTHKFTEI
jgi:hypothetical protein